MTGVQTCALPICISRSRRSRGHRGVWQRRFWEHLIRDEDDLARHLDYVHYNPVKHGHARCPHGWPWSSFGKHVALNDYDAKWCCACEGPAEPPDFSWANGVELE